MTNALTYYDVDAIWILYKVHALWCTSIQQ